MRPRATANVVWLLAVLAGTALRLHQLVDQVLVDDEWHALHVVLAGRPLDVLLSFGESDHSIPLALWDLLLERTIGLSELGMRMPALIAGLATLVVVPALLRPIAGARACATLAWLLAIAPMHVFYSRFARPYEPAMLASFVAVVGLYRAADEERPWLRRVALAAALLAPWLLPVVLPLVATALALTVLRAPAARRWTRMRDGCAASSGVAGVVVVLLGWLVLLGGPALADAGALAGKVGRGTIELAGVLGATELLLGTTSAWLRVACALASVAGAVVLVRRAPRLAAWIALATLAQIAALIVAAPHGLRFAIVLARYLLVVTPFLFLTIALGADAADGALHRRLGGPRRSPVVSTLLVLALVVLGPLWWIHGATSSFTGHASFQADYLPERYFERFRPAHVSSFYEQLAREPAGSLTIVEAPWYFFWHGLAYLQRLHGQHVVVGFVDPDSDTVRPGEVPRARDRIQLRNSLHVADVAALRARGVDYVVFHHDAFAEMQVPFEAPRVAVDHWIELYRREVGPPAFEDEWITVFDLRTEPPDAARAPLS